MFKNLKKSIQKKLDFLLKNSVSLFTVDIDKDEIWNLYLDSFPEGTNEILRERRQYDCSCCRSFVKNYGSIVGIIDGKMVSIWDVKAEGYYQVVVDALNEKITSLPIADVFYSKLSKLGTDSNKELINNSVQTWHHFYYELPDYYVDKSSNSIESLQGNIRQTKQVIQRSVEELDLHAVNTVLELIADKSLYRGEEHLPILTQFKELLNAYKLSDNKDIFLWETAVIMGRLAAIRNTAIGTLLIDLSSGTDLETAIRKYEKVVAPANYKRPKAIFTKQMVADAQKTVKQMGLENSLGRRYARLEDISVQNVLWVSGESKKVMQNPFDDLMEDVKVSPTSFEYADEMNIEDFIKDVLPTATSMEVMIENKHRNNFMSLIAPKDPTAPSLFKWENGFSWAYNGDFTDSIKEAVKSRGGKVDGVLRFSLSWAEGDNGDNSDLDAHCKLPNGKEIYYSSKYDAKSQGSLDVDITNPVDKGNKHIVENITFPLKHKMPKGDYLFYVNNFALRGHQKGFTAEIEFDGKIYNFEYDQALRDKEKVKVAIIHFDGKNFSIKESLHSTQKSKQFWGTSTMKFVPVSTFMFSPNHWDGENGTGNKHYFFMIEKTINDGQPRGFFNEFLKNELAEHKRVFEALGNKMKVEHSENQLSGVGFSSTMKNCITVKVNNKPLKINFNEFSTKSTKKQMAISHA